MADHATPNLPARDMQATADFYASLGFETGYRAEGWMIMARGGLMLEFFPHPDLNPAASSFSCCLRLGDLDAFYSDCLGAGLPETSRGFPRLHPARDEPGGVRVAYLVDLDGTLLRLVQN